MSVINQMLQDLEKRKKAPDEQELIGHIRAVDRINNNALWKMIAAGALLVVVILTWLLLQIRQSPPVSTPPVTAGIIKPKTEALPITPLAQQTPLEVVPPVQVAAVANPAPAIVEEKNQLQNKSVEKPIDLDVQKQLTQPAPKSDKNLKQSPKKKAAIKEAKIIQPVIASNKEIIEKHNRPITPQQHAEEEFRKATVWLNQGRVGEAMQGFRNALGLDARHEASRQALLGLLIESKQFSEAQKLLKETLKNNSNQPGYTMVLARIQVDQGNLDAALETLKANASSANENADYHGFSAALYQRKGDHVQAIEHYQTALRLSPQTAVWLMGLGISLQAMQRNSEALEMFRRAKASGNLTPELLLFVDQRLSQL